MAKSMDDVEFWLPPEFLTDDDILMEVGNNGYNHKNGFETDVAKGLSNPYDVPLGFGSFGFSSDLSSPGESLVGSTETESDEEDYIAGLTRQMAHSTLEDEFACYNRGFSSKGWNMSGSPQSTLCPSGISCGCNRNCQVVPKSAAAWDLLCAAAEEVARMRIADEVVGHNHGRSLLGTPRKPYTVSVPPENPNHGFGNISQQSMYYQKLQAAKFQLLKQRQMMKQQQVSSGWAKGNTGQYPQAIRNAANGRSTALPSSAWPPLHHAQPQQGGSGMRAVFLGTPAGKRESAGTGVFLPRRVTAPSDTRKKPAINTVLLPAKVVHALKLNLDESGVHSQFHPRFNTDSDTAPRLRSGNVAYAQKRSSRPEPTVNQELRLPQDWTY